MLAGETPVLIREIDRADRPRTVLGKEIPCIGRDREVSTMMSIWHECAAVPVARAVLVTAVAGGGKSRVRHELLERIALTGATFDLLVGRGDALRAGAPFTMLGPALRNASGLVGGESPEIARRHLFAHVRRHVPADRAGRVAAFLGEIADVPFPDDDLPALKAARQDPRLMADQTLAAWLDYLEAGCQVNPVLLVLEDLHWGDAPSVHFVDVALRTLRERPLMMLALARPEVDERFPNLWLERDLQRITLPPLTAKAAHRLVHAAAADVSDQQCAWIIERAHGNPFYLEELLRAVAAGAGTGTFPETIIGMVQARFDALGPDAKRVLRAAAIFGQTFHTAAARHLLGGDPELGLDHWLDLLVQKEVLFSRQTADTRELAFRHALMQEAAYDMLTAEDRALGHRLAGEYLEGAGEREAMLLVEHFERGGRPGKAAHWCRLAAEQALDANDLSAVIERVQRSVRCGAEGELLGTVRLLEAQARFWRGEFAAAESTARDAVINSSGNLRFTAIGELITALGQQARFTEVTTWFHQLESSTGVDELPARLGSLIRAAGYLLPAGRYDLTDQLLPRLEELRPAMEPRHRARLDSVKGMLALHRGPQSDAIAAFRSALAVYESLGDQRSAAETLGNVAGSLADMGAFEEAERLLTSALSAAEKLDLRFVIAHVLTSLTYVHANLGQYQAARDSGERARLLAREQGDRRVEGAASIYLATAASAAGLHAAAEAHAREAITVVRDLRAILPAAVTALSRALLAQGRHREALDLSESAYRDLDSMGAVEEGEAWIYLTYAQCLAQDGQRSRAREVIARARARIMERSEAIDLPEWREAFLARRPEHAATLSLAAELLDREGGP